MKSTTKILIAFILIVVIISLAMKKKDSNVTLSVSSIEGCYVATLANDKYTLTVTDESAGMVTGTLAYDNYEKDDSAGTISGTYQNDILLAEYLFSSEGMDSVRQVVFKKTPEGFVQGFGDVKVEGNRESLVNPATASFTASPLFAPSTDC